MFTYILYEIVNITMVNLCSQNTAQLATQVWHTFVIQFSRKSSHAVFVTVLRINMATVDYMSLLFQVPTYLLSLSNSCSGRQYKNSCLHFERCLHDRFNERAIIKKSFKIFFIAIIMRFFTALYTKLRLNIHVNSHFYIRAVVNFSTIKTLY